MVQAASDTMWQLANSLVDPAAPGDFNQALMELGATVCTPRSPSCSSCPVSDLCSARRVAVSAGVPDIEDGCGLCLSDGYDVSQGVMNYPRKAKKTASREETTLVCVLRNDASDESRYGLFQRPKTGNTAIFLISPLFC